MNVIFGLDLDGYTSPRPATTAGHLMTGPKGLLDLLETRLGLRGHYPHDSLRVIEYLGCLRHCDTGAQFYSRSLAVDELAVAQTLLDWRDTWIEAGWRGTAAGSASQRLSDLAVVEQEARQLLSPGLADRLRSIAKHLRESGDIGITLTLIDDPTDLSFAWREVIGHLPTTQLDAPFLPDPLPESSGDLAALQESLLHNSPCRLHGDGSVQLLTAANETMLADGLVSLLADESLRAETTVIRGNRSHVLDLAFSGHNLPITGSAAPSPWRPHLQILPLALSLIWRPLDPYRLLEFLANPVSPLPSFCRQRLAKVVAEYPGIGGDRWHSAIEEIKARAVERADGDTMEAKRIEELIAQWLTTAVYDPDQGAPPEVLADTCALIAQWAVARAITLEEEKPAEAILYSAAGAQARLAGQLLKQLATSQRDRIGRLQLNRLIDQVTAEGTRRTDQYPECGHVHIVHAPGACRERNGTVCWYHFTAPNLPARWPWDERELRVLAENGADLPAAERLLQREAAKWLLPARAASDRLIFLQPCSSGGEPTVAHPLWQRIAALTDDTVPRVNLDTVLANNCDTGRLNIAVEPIRPLPLARPKRWWQLGSPALLTCREQESFSSLKAFLESPYQWVLRYHARIRPGSLAEIIDGNRQSGTLLHHLLERLFQPGGFDWQHASNAALTNWVEQTFTDLLHTEGANFLLPGRTPERENLHDMALHACTDLIGQLRAAGVVSVCMEQQVQGSFLGGRVAGFIDMLVTNRKGREALIDLKLGGGSYRADELKENRHLQLAIYSWLRRGETAMLPEPAYYIFSERRLLAQNTDFFPGAEVFAPDDEQGAAALWAAFESTWRWRRQQLDQGQIEVTVTGTESDGRSLAPEGGLAIDEHNDRFNEYATLTGWSEDA